MSKITLSLSPELRLEQALNEAGVENPATVTRLTIVGALEYSELWYICDKMGGTLRELDLGAASLPDDVVATTAFWGFTALTSVIIPETAVEIDSLAFFGCTRLSSVIIPASVTKISGDWAWAFKGCTGLTSIEVHPDNPVYTSENGVLFNKDKSAFAFCDGFAYVTIPVSAIKFNDYHTFAFCGSKNSIVIPDSIVWVGREIVDNCEGLTPVAGLAPVTVVDDFVIHSNKCLPSYFIPNSATDIRRMALYKCEYLRRVTIPDKVKNVNYRILTGISVLKSVFVPEKEK
jgi:hypothetical protein